LGANTHPRAGSGTAAVRRGSRGPGDGARLDPRFWAPLRRQNRPSNMPGFSGDWRGLPFVTPKCFLNSASLSAADLRRRSPKNAHSSPSWLFRPTLRTQSPDCISAPSRFFSAARIVPRPNTHGCFAIRAYRTPDSAKPRCRRTPRRFAPAQTRHSSSRQNTRPDCSKAPELRQRFQFRNVPKPGSARLYVD
jgi:hypothetical protein